MIKRIVTLSVNPAIDRTMYFDGFTVGTLNRTVRQTVVSAGSKGMNAARAILAAGGDVLSLSFSGGSGGAFLESEMKREGIPSRFIETACGVRENIKIIDTDGTGTEANDRGGPVSEDELREFTRAALELSDSETLFIMSGSIPPGVPVSFYRTLTEAVKDKGSTVVLDCDGEAMREGIKAVPNLIKPNKRELESFLSLKINDLSEAASAAKKTAASYGCEVLLTLGENGSVLASPEEKAIYVNTPKDIKVLGFAGAGDTYLGVYCTERYIKGRDEESAMIAAASASAAKVETPGSLLPKCEELKKYESALTAVRV